MGAEFSLPRHFIPLHGVYFPPLYRLKLKSLHRFTSTAIAVEEITAIQEGKLGKGLKEFLNKVIVEKGKNKEELVVVDPKLGAFPVASSHAPHKPANACLSSSPNQQKAGNQGDLRHRHPRSLSWNSQSIERSVERSRSKGPRDDESRPQPFVI